MMKPQQLLPLLFLAALTGCTTSDTDLLPEYVLKEVQQNTYLSHAKPAEGFGQGRAEPGPNQNTMVVLFKGGIPVIEMQGRTSRMKMNTLLDTSSPSSWIEFGASRDMKTTFLETGGHPIAYQGKYNTGNVPSYLAILTPLHINQLSIENCPLFVRMAINTLGPMARGIKIPKVDAALGYDFLETFEYVQFDFDLDVVEFSSTAPYTPRQDLLMTTAKIIPQPGYGLAIEGAIFGEPTPILLDIAGDYHFSRGDVKVSTTKQVSLGNVVYRKVPTLLLPFNSSPPRAGRGMLQKYIITICPRKGVVYFERFPK